MKLHIIRHAEAVDRSPFLLEEYRYLTCRGRIRFRRVAETLKKCSITPDLIISSPLVRAVQTAEILASTVRFSREVIILPFLSGTFRLQQLREYLVSIPHVHELALVGHEPDLGHITGELLDHSPCSLKKGMVVTLTVEFQQGISAEFVRMVTGGGRLIPDHGAAMARLSGSSR